MSEYKLIKYDLALIAGLLKGESFIIGDHEIKIDPDDLKDRETWELFDEIQYEMSND